MTGLQTTQRVIPEGLIDLGIGQPSLSLLPLDALRTAADHCLAHGNAELLQYGSDQGDAYFRHALAAFLSRRYMTSVLPDQLMVTASASQGLDLVCTRFANRGDTIFVEEPTYFLALLVFRDHGLNVVGIPTDASGIRVDALEAALTQHRPAFLYTIPTFQNPSAVTMSAARRERLATISRERDLLVVADEVYHLLDFGDAPPPPLSAYATTMPAGHGQSRPARFLSLGSFSKICAPGLRLGWVQSDAATLDTLMTSGLVQSGGGLNPFTSGVMRSMLELGLEDTCLDHLQAVYRARAAVMCDALREAIPMASFVEPRGGFFVWLELPPDIDVTRVQRDAAHAGVNFQAGTRFAHGEAFGHCIRLSFAHYEADALAEGVRRLARVLDPSGPA